MSQGYAGIPYVKGDVLLNEAGLDGFSRLPVSNPQSLFDAQFTYDLQPLLYEQITNGTGASISHDATNRMAVMTFASTPTGGKSIMQTFEHFRYQPGKAQQPIITFNMNGAVANCSKFASYGTDTNAYIYYLNESGGSPLHQVGLLSSTNEGNKIYDQADWNIDKLDGSGKSGITLAEDKEQIFLVDFQALYVGRVRFGFDIGGSVIWVHEINNANETEKPYIATANLPVRVGMTCAGTVSTTMWFNCNSVISMGGQDETAGYPNSARAGSIAVPNGSWVHGIAIRPATTYNSIENRSQIVFADINIYNRGNNPVWWRIGVGQALTTPSFTGVGTYSAFEYDTSGTLSGSPAYVMLQDEVLATASVKQSVSRSFATRYPITLNAAGAVRDLGTAELQVYGIGGTSTVDVIINWREIR